MAMCIFNHMRTEKLVSSAGNSESYSTPRQTCTVRHVTKKRCDSQPDARFSISVRPEENYVNKCRPAYERHCFEFPENSFLGAVDQ